MSKKPGRKMPGQENVFVMGVRGDEFVPAVTPEQIDEMLKESLGIQREQINDFVRDMRENPELSKMNDIETYGSLMRHLQGQCAVHLSALAAAAIMRIRDYEERSGG